MTPSDTQCPSVAKQKEAKRLQERILRARKLLRQHIRRSRARARDDAEFTRRCSEHTHCTSCGVDMMVDASHIDWIAVRGFESDPCDDWCVQHPACCSTRSWSSTCSSPAPHLLLTCSSLALACSSPAPRLLLACSSPAPRLLLACPSLAPRLLIACPSPAHRLLLACSSSALLHLHSCCGGCGSRKNYPGECHC